MAAITLISSFMPLFAQDSVDPIMRAPSGHMLTGQEAEALAQAERTSQVFDNAEGGQNNQVLPVSAASESKTQSPNLEALANPESPVVKKNDGKKKEDEGPGFFESMGKFIWGALSGKLGYGMIAGAIIGLGVAALVGSSLMVGAATGAGVVLLFGIFLWALMGIAA